MITYQQVKNYITNNIESIERDDFYLLEGKLVFKDLSKANTVCTYFEHRNLTVILIKQKFGIIGTLSMQLRCTFLMDLRILNGTN